MDINLLPWREERRQLRDRKMVGYAIMVWIICGAIVFAVITFLNSKQDTQTKRNKYLQTEIRKLDKKLQEIKTLQAQKEDLLLRMQVIQDLQGERRRVVHLFDDIVRKLPEGVFYVSLVKKKNNLSLSGTAQSNARVSDLMNRLDSSEWFTNTNLSVIDVTPSKGVRLSKFKLNVAEDKGDNGSIKEVN